MREYELFELCVRSEFILEEAAPFRGAGGIDVTIRKGKLSLDPLTHPKTVYYGQDNEYWYCLPETNRIIFNNFTGAYEIANSNEIVADLFEGANEDYVRAYLLGTSLAAIHMQRGNFPIHGGALELGDKAVIVTGQQGAGKSTVTDALIGRGLRFLSDDVCVVSFDSGTPEVLASYPQRKLCRDACIAHGYNLDELVWINEDRDKFAIRRGHEWRSGRMPLGSLVEIVPADVDEVEIKKIDGQKKLGLLFSSLYRYWILNGMGITPQKMKMLFTIAAKTDMYRITRPKDAETVNKVADLILSGVGK